jgi:hypothetical protein
MKAQFLKMGGVTSEKEFYKKFPTEESFFAAYPEAQMMKGGGTFSGNTYYQDGGDSPALWHSEWNEDEFNPYNEQNLDNTVQNDIAKQANKKPKRDPNKGLKDYLAINTGLDMTTGLINQFNNRNRDREMTAFMQRQGMADNLFPVTGGNFSGSQGNYAVTGSGYGQFRPDQMGAKSPDGMYNGMFYPQMRDGGNFADRYEVASFDALSDATLSRNNNAFLETPAENTASPTGALTIKNVKVNDTAKSAYDYYVNERNLQPHIAAGIIGNLYQESKLKTTAVEKGNTGNGRGIAQWDVRDRWKGLLNWAANSGRDPYNLQTQLDYVLEEPGEGKKALKKLKATTTPEQAAIVFGRTYERPSEKHANWNYRASVASKLYNQQFKNGGEYELTADEIMTIRANGGEIEFL